MNCWYMTEVGSRLSSNRGMGKDSSMDHGAIVRSIILLLSLSYHVGDKARDPNPKYLRGVLSRGLHRGEKGGNIPPLPSSPVGKRNNNGRATGNATSGESSCIKSGWSR